MHTVFCRVVASLPLLLGVRAVTAQDRTIGDVADVREIDRLDFTGPYKRIWQPHLAEWKPQHLVCCYGLELRGKYDMGDIVCSVSTDGGVTWSPRTMVFDHRQRNGTVQYAYNNAVLFRPPDQDVIWLYCMRAPLHYRDSENSQLTAAYTADGGLSWQHVELSVGYQGPLIIVGGITTVHRNGVPHFLLPAHRNTRRHDPHGDRRQFVLQSTSLVRWTMADYIDYPADSPVFLHEGRIGSNDDGEGIKIVMRTSRMDRERPLDPPVAWSAVSLDGGESWSEAQPEPNLPNYRSKAFFGRSRSGQHIYVYSDNFEREGLWYKTRRSETSWSEARRFYNVNNRNSYPTLIESKTGQWLAVWDSSDEPDRQRTVIRFGRLEQRGD